MKSIIVTRQNAINKENVLRLLGFKVNRDHGNWIAKDVDNGKVRVICDKLNVLKVTFMTK